MKKVLSMVLAVVMLASVLSLCFVSTFTASAAGVETVVSKGQEWEYLAWQDVLFSDGTATIPEGALVGTDSETWNKGNAMFGEGRTTDFGWGNFASLLRTTFTLDSVSSIEAMKLYIIYDENPTVYLNGEEVWAVNDPGAYHDSGYIEVDLSAHVGKLVEGTNYFCIAWEESFGGSVMDAELIVASSFIDENGYIVPVGATAEGVYSFGDINKAENAIDWVSDSVCGDGSYEDNAITVTFDKVYTLGEIFIRCKNEGAAVNEDGSYGTYDIYAIKDGAPSKIATNVPAMPVAVNSTEVETTEGYTVTLDGAYEADAIKVVVTSWTGPGWACVGDVAAKPAADGAELAATDCEGNPMIAKLEARDFNATIADIIDGRNSSCAASHPDNIGKGRVQLYFRDTAVIDSIYVESKNEGMDQLPEGDRVAGTYDVYVVMGSAWNLVATDVPATPDGYTIEFEEAYAADGIAIIVTSWKNNMWTTLSEFQAFSAEEGATLATTDVNGDPLMTSIKIEGMYNFGWYWNDAHLLFDGHYDTMTGSGLGESMTFTLTFAEDQWFDSITATAKNEGTANLGDSCFGKATFYVVDDGIETAVATDVEIWTNAAVNGGVNVSAPVTFEATKGDAIKVVITEWFAEGWAGFAEMDYTTTEAPVDTVAGDYTGEGEVSIADVAALLDYLAGKGEVSGDPDYTGDGSASIADVAALLDFLAGK